jgi:large subunit ribosomal protein L35
MTKRGNRFLRQQTGMTLVSESDSRIIKRNFFPYER